MTNKTLQQAFTELWLAIDILVAVCKKAIKDDYELIRKTLGY